MSNHNYVHIYFMIQKGYPLFKEMHSCIPCRTDAFGHVRDFREIT